MRKKLQVFVSSTYDDLEEERQTAIEAILNAGHIPAGMELFKGWKSKKETIKRWIDESDVYVLILGGRYETIDENEKMSYIEMEYRYAVGKGMPTFAVVLSDKMILQKAAKEGENKVRETRHRNLYKAFKKYVKNNIVVFVDSNEGIAGAILAHLNDISNDPSLSLGGWVRTDEVEINMTDLAQDKLKTIYTNAFVEYISKNYDVDVKEYIKSSTEKFTRAMINIGILESAHRIVEIEKYSESLTKVTVIDMLEYKYLSKEHQAFGKRFQATKQQAETYKVEKLLINQQDYTDDFRIQVQKDVNRGQLLYYVQSRKSLPIDYIPGNIYYKASYLCPPLDFFQAYGLPFPCRDFSVDIHLKGEIEQMYSVVTSTFSPFSKTYSDSYQANEIKNFGVCSLKLPQWSMAGTGYVASLKNKTENNH